MYHLFKKLIKKVSKTKLKQKSKLKIIKIKIQLKLEDKFQLEKIFMKIYIQKIIKFYN